MGTFKSSVYARVGLLAFTALLVGCVAKPNVSLQQYSYSGEHGRAREMLLPTLVDNGKKPDGNYLLNRMRFGIEALADGYSCDDPVFGEIYTVLSTQGLNKDQQLTALLLNEDLKTWKGQPFEQAIMLSYLSMYYGMQNSWDNSRAAASSSQFYLAELNKEKFKKALPDAAKQRDEPTNEDVVQIARTDKELFSANNYTARETDFSLGILLDAIANRQLDKISPDAARDEEAVSKFNRVWELRPDLQELLGEINAGDYDALLVVAWGQGPQKIGVGPDRAIADWMIHSASTDDKLVVNSGGNQHAYALICDVNKMAKNHMWNSLQDVRLAKSYLGTAAVGAGAVVTAVGVQRRDTKTALIGAGIMAIGAIMKAGAHCDTRYCEIMPQRFYVVPVKASEDGAPIELQVENHPESRMRLCGIAPAKRDQPAPMRYVHLISKPAPSTVWASAGQILYNNDYVTVNAAKPFPYILGGDCVRKPTAEALSYYQAAGYLKDMSLEELQNLYRDENITFDSNGALRTRHILEGGRSMEVPPPGTVGFARLFGQSHPAYVPKSASVRAARSQMLTTAPGSVASAGQ